jgi:predicted dehydrogenase
MEIYGKNGKLEIAGLGGSYGLEKLTHYEMLPQMGPPLTTSWEFPRGDNSWELEMDDFYEDVCKNRDPSPGLKDAIAALKIINQIYRESGYDYCS